MSKVIVKGDRKGEYRELEKEVLKTKCEQRSRYPKDPLQVVTGTELELVKLVMQKMTGTGVDVEEYLLTNLPGLHFPFQVDLNHKVIGNVIGDEVEQRSAWPQGKLLWKGKRTFGFAKLCAEPIRDGVAIFVDMGLNTQNGPWYAEQWPLSGFLNKCANHLSVIDAVKNHQINI